MLVCVCVVLNEHIILSAYDSTNLATKLDILNMDAPVEHVVF